MGMESCGSITFSKVHKVFGASKVSKLLSEVPEEQRQETVNSLAYEAAVRLKNPVYGCIGAIASPQQKMLEPQHDIALACSLLLAHSISMIMFSEFDDGEKAHATLLVAAFLIILRANIDLLGIQRYILCFRASYE
ncbi:hypothetical protein F2Q70_00037510 [Brassica cretica]|uniref:LOB domain-containing protein n=1 Tax=Brassica cretica TaxID=69181 RepID=A0A8S9JVF3_BRACR|nr:hypothetical protein F2Q70_00037510 [Brassica cretica]